MARIEIVEPEDASGRLKEIYDDLMEKRGKIAEIHKILSLNPECLRAHMDLYMKIMFGSSPLSRADREMMAVVVSATNGCDYCQAHHAQALMHFWKDENQVQTLKIDYRRAGLDDSQVALCRFAETVTREPTASEERDLSAELREAGFDDRAVLDATLVTAYFNFVNRIVLTLGVELEDDPGGYRYE